MKREAYSRKWGRINWWRANKKIPVVFSNPRIEETPYNEKLFGPRLMTGWIKGMYGVPMEGIFHVRSGNIDYDVNPMEDGNFRIASYEEIEKSQDLIKMP